MSKKKILIILSSKYYNKYLIFNSFQKLNKKYKLTFALKDNFAKKNKNFEFYRLNSNDRLILKYFHLIRIRSLKKIKSLITSILKRFPTYKFYKNLFHEKNQKFPFLFYLRNHYIKRIFYKILSISPFFQLYKKFLFLKIKKKTEIDILIDKIRPDLIIYPTHFMEPEMIYINRSAKKNNSKTFYIVDNWDNLTTKAAMFQKSDFLGVWGQQSKKHAIKFHNYKSKNVFLLGNNRIDKYFEYRKKKYANIIKNDKPYILFLGSNLLIKEELNFLKILDKKIYEYNLQDSFKIVYRFHPQLIDIFKSEISEIDFHNIEINNPLYKFSFLNERNLIRKKTQFKDYFPIIQNAQFLMGMVITTVTIEGFIFGKNYIVLDCIDKKNAHVANILEKYSIHRKGIDKIAIFKRVKSYDQLFTYIKNNNKKISQKKIDDQINYFYYNKNTNYQSKIFKSVNKIFNQK